LIEDKQNWADAKALQGETELARGQVKNVFFCTFQKFESRLPTEIVTHS